LGAARRIRARQKGGLRRNEDPPVASIRRNCDAARRILSAIFPAPPGRTPGDLARTPGGFRAVRCSIFPDRRVEDCDQPRARLSTSKFATTGDDMKGAVETIEYPTAFWR
jgi:hypothetical protein